MKALIIGPWYPTELWCTRRESMFGQSWITVRRLRDPAYKQLAERYNKTYKRMLDNTRSPVRNGQIVADAIQNRTPPTEGGRRCDSQGTSNCRVTPGHFPSPSGAR